MWTMTRRGGDGSGTTPERTPPGRRVRAQSATRIDPTPEKPSFERVAAVRSYSRPPTYGPRSTTGTRTVRPPWRSVTFDPHGSDLFATPSVPGVSVPPQPSRPPYSPGPYHDTCARRYTFRRPTRSRAAPERTRTTALPGSRGRKRNANEPSPAV